MKLNKAFTLREKALLLVLGLLLLAAAYFFLIHQPISQQMGEIKAQTETVQQELDQMSVLKAHMDKMESELAELKDTASPIPDYDNLQNVMVFLDHVLTSATEYTLNFQGLTPTESEDIVSRGVSMNLNVSSYSQARAILETLEAAPYRCLIDEVSMDPDGTSLEDGPVSLSVSLTFYELKQ